jgi:hypothetical protein
VDRETLAPLGLAPLGPVGEVSLVLQPDQGEPPARDVLHVVIGDFGGQPYAGIPGARCADGLHPDSRRRGLDDRVLSLLKDPAADRGTARRAFTALVAGVGNILFSDALVADGALVFAKACEMGLEGIVSKRAGSRYSSGNSRRTAG